MGHWEAFWDELRPRFVTLKLRAGRLRLRWAFPLWALEEALVFATKLAPLLPLVRRTQGGAQPGASTRLLPVLGALLTDDVKHLLHLPRGEAFLRVQARGTELEIGQL